MKLVTKSLERGFYAATNPVAEWLLRSHVRPNTLTTAGALLVVISAAAYAFGWIRTGGALLLASGVVDTFDGQVARRGGMVSKFGAFYDSTLDRVGDGATFIGIAAYLLAVVPARLKKDVVKDGVPGCVRDLFSALYFVRRLEFYQGASHKALVGDDDKFKEVLSRVERSEMVETPAGKFQTWRVNTVALVGGLFKEGGQFRMWLTADERKLPVQFEAKVSLGTVSGKLQSAEF